MVDKSALPVKSAMRTLDIIELVVARPSGLVAQDIALALSIPVSSLSYLLSTLVERGYLKRDGRRYLPGSGLDRLRAPRADLSLADRVAPVVKALRQQLNETVSFFVRSGWMLEALVTETSDQALRYSISMGTRAPMHCMAAGKALLAALGPADVDRYFAESERAPMTPNSIVDETALRRELEITRVKGIGRTREEYTLGIVGMGCAVLKDGVPVGALSIAVPTPRFTPALEALAIERLTRAAALFEDEAG